MIFEIIYVVRVRVGERAACRRQASLQRETSRTEAQRKRHRRGVGTCTAQLLERLRPKRSYAAGFTTTLRNRDLY